MFVGLENIGILFKGLKYYTDRQIQRTSRSMLREYGLTSEMVYECFLEEGLMNPIMDEDGYTYAEPDENGGYTIFIY